MARSAVSSSSVRPASSRRPACSSRVMDACS
jgi:hypothetical protein